MKLENLTPAKGSTKTRKRIGRGEGSGRGGTSTRGMNGAGQRSGFSHKIGFEGGQMPLQRRMPKFGFKNPTRVEFKAVNVATLETIAKKFNLTEIGVDDIKAAGFASKNDLIKVLGNGELKAAITVTADAFSKSAVAKIEAAGGKAVVAE